jgi:GNAT superfamily N-acetyltransferase
MPELDEYLNATAVPFPPVGDPRLLDNPIWNSLNTEHGALALGDGLARRFPVEIGPLSGLIEQSDEAYEALRMLAGPGGVVAQFLESPMPMRSGWEMVRDGLMSQMIWSEADGPGAAAPREQALLRPLTAADVPAMLELTALTEPGPYGRRTHELGAFFGIFDGECLLAMAGERLAVPGFVEVSAVCTHPDARGRGYARTLMLEVMTDILRKGATPFLHVFAANESAIRVYEGLGFRYRRTLHLAVLKAV